MRRALSLLPGLLVLALLWGPSLWWPLGRDQGVFAAVADVINDGGLPYRDAWDIKPPLVYHLYAAAILPLEWIGFDRVDDVRDALSGNDPLHLMMPIRVLDLLMVGATLVFATLLFPPRRRALLGVLIALPLGLVHFFLGGYWNAAIPDNWTALFAMMGLWVWRWWGRRFPRRSCLAMGLFAGCAFWMKFTAGVYLVLFALLMFGQALHRLRCSTGNPACASENPARTPGNPACALRRMIGGWLTLLAGFLLTSALIVGCYATRGAWPAMREVLFEYVFLYAGFAASGPDDLIFIGYNLSAMVRGVGNLIAWHPLLVLPPLGLLCIAALRRRLMQPALWLALLLAFVSVAVQRKFYMNHMGALVLWLSVLSALFWERVLRWIQHRRRHRNWRPGAGFLAVALVCPALALLTLGSTVFRERWETLFLTPPLVDHGAGDYLARFETGDFSLLNDLDAASSASFHVPQGRALVVWGFEPLVHYLADRRSPSRFLFNVPIVAPHPEKAWREEFLRDLGHPSVRMLVVFMDDDQWHVTGVRGTSLELLLAWSEMRAVVEREYRDFGPGPPSIDWERRLTWQGRNPRDFFTLQRGTTGPNSGRTSE